LGRKCQYRDGAYRRGLTQAGSRRDIVAKVVAKYSAPASPDNAKIAVRFVEGWWAGTDALALQNLGADLEDCTIAVKLIGEKDESQTNVHFVPKWAGKSFVIARYSPGESVLGQTLNRTTVNHPRSVTILIQSPKFSTHISYTCNSQDQDKAVAEICKDLKLVGSFAENRKAVLVSHKYSASVTMDGVAFIPKGQISLTLNPKDGSKRVQKTVEFPFASWRKGETKSFALPFEPDSMNVAVTFPNTGYRYDTKFDN
jgi:hypothetical protein